MPEVLDIIDFFPTRGLNRSISPHALQPDQARLLSHCDISYMENRLRRGPGICRTQVSGPGVDDFDRETTVTSCGVWHTRSGKLLLVDHTSNGIVRMTPGDGSVPGAGPLPFCIERDDYNECCGDEEDGTEGDVPACGGGGFSQNFSDDCGVPPEDQGCEGVVPAYFMPAPPFIGGVVSPVRCGTAVIVDSEGNIFFLAP